MQATEVPPEPVCHDGPVEPAPPLEALPVVAVERIELVVVDVPVAAALRTSRASAGAASRSVLLVHVAVDGVDGWAECAVEDRPTYGPEFTAAARLTLRDHLVPRVLASPAAGDALALGPVLDEVRGHPAARAAVELAVLDAQLRAAGRSLGSWLGATEPTVAAGATLGLHDAPTGLLAEADEALAAGARRLRAKIGPGRVDQIAALVAHVGGEVPVQVDANGSFPVGHPELEQLDELGLACIEQPHPPADLVASARLAARLRTPVCLDEAVTSLGAIEAIAELRAASAVCLKPARVGGWPDARAAQHRARELGLGVWVGGMLETAVGRAANAAVAALPGMTAAGDFDPRPRYAVELAEPLAIRDGWVTVPTTAGANPSPDPAALGGAVVEVVSRA
jgi:O-succinylbenzoate synthase